MKKLTLFVWICLASFGFEQLARAQKATGRRPVPGKAASSERVQDGLNGPVRRVRVENAKIVIKDGKPIEGPRVVWGITNYDDHGRRIDSVAHPLEEGAPPGKRQYRHDDRGNIIEMVLRSDDGSILRQEVYEYEFDKLGNWKKMTASVAVDEDGKLGFEPTQVTYRTITYYYVQAIDQRATASPANPAAVSDPSIGSLSEGRVSNLRKTEDMNGGALEKGAKEEAPLQIGPDDKKSAINSPTPSIASEPEDRKAVKNSPAKSDETQAPIPVAPPGSPDKMPSPPVAAAMVSVSSETKKVTARAGAASRSSSDTAVPSGGTSVTASVAPGTSSAGDANYLYKQGLSYLTSGQYSQAVEALKQAVNLYPEDAVAYAKLGLAYTALRQYKEAVAVFKMAIRIKGEVVDAEAYYRLGEAYAALGQHSEALGAFNQAMYITRAQAIEPDPSSYQGFPTLAELHYGLGLAYHNLGRHPEAIKELKQATVLNPRFTEAHYGLAAAYIALGDRKSAAQQEKILRPLNAALADQIVRALSLTHVRPPGTTEGILGPSQKP